MYPFGRELGDNNKMIVSLLLVRVHARPAATEIINRPVGRSPA